jgi:hypothetical protein
MQRLRALEVIPAPDSPEALLESALRSRNFTLTETYRRELLLLLGESGDPDRTLLLGLAIYANAINQGDTSACVEILLDAVHGTRGSVRRTVNGVAWAAS